MTSISGASWFLLFLVAISLGITAGVFVNDLIVRYRRQHEARQWLRNLMRQRA